jgi:streptomycin 6-kinase
MFIIPDDFIEQASAFHGEKGLDWLRRLPTILINCEQRWGLTIAQPFAYESYAYHYVAPATRSNGQAVVVKAHAPTNEFVQEAEALRLCAGHGMARLLDYDMHDRVLLLERLLPGTPLLEIEDDEEATSYAAGVMRQLWRPVPAGHPFPSVADWGQGFQRLRQHYAGNSGPFPPALLAEAESLYAEMTASMTEHVLLHGDLHHENILTAEREPWLAIDPKGLVGEPAYETGALLRNRHPDLHELAGARKILARRIDILAEELDLSRTRVRNWAVAQAVLALWWTIEDGGDIEEVGLTCAKLLAEIKR